MKSFGVHCAKMAGYPADILERARDLMKEYEFELNISPTNNELSNDPRAPEMEYFKLIQVRYSCCNVFSNTSSLGWIGFFP